jgi:hypothetical protein
MCAALFSLNATVCQKGNEFGSQESSEGEFNPKFLASWFPEQSFFKLCSK